MEYRSLGNSGLRVSVAGLGCNNFGMRVDYDRTVEVLNAAIEGGEDRIPGSILFGVRRIE